MPLMRVWVRWCLVAARIGMTVSIPNAMRPVLDANRPDLELAVVGLEDDVVIVVGLPVDDPAQPLALGLFLRARSPALALHRHHVRRAIMHNSVNQGCEPLHCVSLLIACTS